MDKWEKCVPVLQVKDAQASTAFYCDVLGFKKDWEHRFSDDFPLYVSVSRGHLCFHLSEHLGGGIKKGDFFIPVVDVDATYSVLIERGLKTESQPQDQEYGLRDFDFSDLDGHHFSMGTALATES